MNANLIEELISALLSIDRLKIRELIEPSSSVTNEQITEFLIVPALEEIGKKWEEGEIAISQVYMAGILIEEAMNNIIPEPDLSDKQRHQIATVVLEDYHMLGEKIVSAYLAGAGYYPVRYGRRDAQEVISLVRRDGIRYLLISVLMLPSALKVKAITTALKGEGVTVIVGGAPFRLDPHLGEEVGADYVCYTASDAINALRHRGVSP